jgi:histidinol-phosphate/aromatic aminotransferase/cobyric acid decarboxylase-like protein
MNPSHTPRDLVEKGFDDDLSQEALESVDKIFPSADAVNEALMKDRSSRGFVDMKRGELYPEIIGGSARLRRTLARIYEVDEMQAQPNFGCNGCIDAFLTFVKFGELADPKRNGLAVATPTYFRYNHKVAALQLRMLEVSFLKNGAYPVEAALELLKKGKPSCFFIVTPNNPTGVPLTDNELFHLLDHIPESVYTVIDRTCANIDDEVSTRELLKRYTGKNLVIFHSFSKYYGLSHLRIGFSVFANRTLAAEVNRYIPFGINLEASLKATRILLTDGELKPRNVLLKEIQENRELMRAFVRENPSYGMTDFKSNYSLLTLPATINSKDFDARLQKEGIFVLAGHDFPRPNERLVRIHTGGQKKHLARMLDLIRTW